MLYGYRYNCYWVIELLLNNFVYLTEKYSLIRAIIHMQLGKFPSFINTVPKIVDISKLEIVNFNEISIH